MNTPQPLRRAFFYVPASNPRFIEKALLSSADCIVLDLEDGVAPSEKDSARDNVLSLLKRLKTEGYRPGENKGAELCLRINHEGWPHSAWGGFKTDLHAPSKELDDDLELLIQPEARGLTIVIPKTGYHGVLEDIRKVLMDKKRVDHKAAPEEEEYRVIPLIENASGVMELKEIARWRRRVSAIVFAAEDYCADVGIPRTGDWTNMNYARSAIVNACRQNNVTPIDMVCQDIRNITVLQEECDNAVYTGFQGKQCVHPDQIGTIQRSFAPKPEEVDWA